MNSVVIPLDSPTIAMKAKKLLSKMGYKVSIEKSVNRSSGGCKTNIRVNGNINTICNELAKAGISCR